mmetsp:Transcript_35409/g.60157  ORF Transcript_35409/g.60157 Transcript_35409/m.60157 type:complete len:655 (-) Transcript_35409:29-1993(-)
MGKRGKAARKRRRENEVNTASLASKLVKRSADVVIADASQQHRDGNSTDADLVETVTAQHGISNDALDTTVATLHRLCGLVDPATGKLALKDKRYRSLRKVLYELQASSGGQMQTSGNNSNNGVASLLSSTGSDAPLPISSSKITHEISAQIDNGAYELAVTTLRNVRKRQEEQYSKQSTTGGAKGTATTAKENGRWRPKLGAVQRWIRQIDAAGTEDPLALQVIDAILRVVAPDEGIVPVDEGDMKKAKWTRLGVSNASTECDGKYLEGGGSIRLFCPFDRRPKDNLDPKSEDRVESDVFDTLVACMNVDDDGIRRISCTELKVHREKLFRKCGYEKGQDRKPPNKYDLELLTTSSTVETKNIKECNNTSAKILSFSGEQVLLTDLNNRLPVVKSPLPYVQDSFLLENVLSPAECNRLIAAAETAGYNPDEPVAGQPGASILAHACVWVVDHNLERTIFERVREFLPSYNKSKEHNQDPGEGAETTAFQPLGLNRRFRFYRYVPGRYYRPHIDGAWPKSGFDRNGNYRYDVCDEDNKNGLQFVEQGKESSQDGHKEDEDITKQPQREAPDIGRKQLSRLTFLIYLNDDFDGGATTFLLPAQEKEGILNAFPIRPVRGGVLVFPHGTCAAPLHEGSPVLKRCKYVVRTEVEYYI